MTRLLLGMIVVISGCASVNSSLTGMNAAKQLTVIPGEVTLQVSKPAATELTMPATPRLSSGRVLAFSPVEFRSDKDRYSIITDSLPLGRYVALRHGGEGVLADIGKADAKAFTVHYDARYADMDSARKDFPTLAAERFKTVTLNAKAQIEIEQWHYRLTMLFSKDRQAYRVLLDQIEYIAPQPPAPPANMTESGVTASPPPPPNIPIIVAFAYRHPDAVTETTVQQNILFEFTVQTATGIYQGKPQLSAWIPLHGHAEITPYNVSVVVAEVNVQDEQFYTKLLDFVKTIRGVI